MSRRFRLGVVAFAASCVAACSAAGPGEEIGTSSSPITFPNDQPAYDYFVGKGLTSFQAAGIVGNLDQESGVDPSAVQSGGPGRGIAQWSVGGRWDTDANDNATWYATSQGQNLLSLQLQLDFIWYELTSFPAYGLAELQQTTNVTDATTVFETSFEGCGTCDQSQRISYAQNVLQAFGGNSPDGGPAAVDGGGATPCMISTGEPGECLDTSACATSGRVSTPGLCPGPSNIQCCTGSSVVDAAARDAGTSVEPDGAEPDGASRVLDAAAGGSRRDAISPERAADAAGVAPVGSPSSSSSGGCTTSPIGNAPDGSGAWLASAISLALWRSRGRRRVVTARGQRSSESDSIKG